MRRRGPFRKEGQLEVVDDAVNHSPVSEESDDLHLSAASRAEHGIDFIRFTDHLGPALGRLTLRLLLHHPERKSFKTRLLDVSPMSIGVEAVISDSDLAFIRNMGSHPGDELQVVHPLHFFGLFAILVADLGCAFIEGEAFQGKRIA
jgi:hypothetical protein